MPGRKRIATKIALLAQATELRALRGKRTLKAWVAILAVGGRSYIRYEQGQRVAPPSVMKLARLSGKKRGA